MYWYKLAYMAGAAEAFKFMSGYLADAYIDQKFDGYLPKFQEEFDKYINNRFKEVNFKEEIEED